MFGIVNAILVLLYQEGSWPASDSFRQHALEPATTSLESMDDFIVNRHLLWYYDTVIVEQILAVEV
jgi:hypothetical protein